MRISLSLLYKSVYCFSVARLYSLVQAVRKKHEKMKKIPNANLRELHANGRE